MINSEIDIYIKSISTTSWNRLFDLIPRIQSTSKFGKWKDGEKNSNGIIETPALILNNVVKDFTSIMYELELVLDFDWVNWDKGAEILRSGNFEKEDTITLIKLLTSIIRNDRFNEGLLVDMFENNTIERILTQVKSNTIRT